MRDILNDILKILSKDESVTSIFGENIWIQYYPNTEDFREPFIVLDEVDDTLPREFASNDNMALSYLVSVEVWVPSSNKYISYEVCRNLSYYISRLLYEQYGLINTANSKPEYNNEIKYYRRTRTYQGTYYRKDLNIDGS